MRLRMVYVSIVQTELIIAEDATFGMKSSCVLNVLVTLCSQEKVTVHVTMLSMLMLKISQTEMMQNANFVIKRLIIATCVRAR